MNEANFQIHQDASLSNLVNDNLAWGNSWGIHKRKQKLENLWNWKLMTVRLTAKSCQMQVSTTDASFGLFIPFKLFIQILT